MIDALIIPIRRVNSGLALIFLVNLPVYAKTTPTLIMTAPRPILKRITRVNPLVIRPAAMAARRVAIAAGHGIKPPEIPSNKRFHRLFFGGSFLATAPPGCECESLEWL